MEPGWVEIIPRKRVTVQVRTWLLSAHTFLGGDKGWVTTWGGKRGHTRAPRVPQAPTGDEVLLRQHDLGDGAAVHGEGLEELGARAHRLGVLHDHPHHARAGAVGDLDPVAAVAWEETQNGRFWTQKRLTSWLRYAGGEKLVGMSPKGVAPPRGGEDSTARPGGGTRMSPGWWGPPRGDGDLSRVIRTSSKGWDPP